MQHKGVTSQIFPSCYVSVLHYLCIKQELVFPGKWLQHAEFVSGLLFLLGVLIWLLDISIYNQMVLVLDFLLQITDLSQDFEPQYNPLRILRSVDLLPNSWLSVAWYPIYRIPTGPTLRDLAACFLTYHSLSTPMNGTSEGARQLPSCSEPCDMPTLCSRETSRLELRAFGLTSYKLRGALWTSNVERRQATLLQNSASVHLKQLDVEHPDYIFFTSHSNSRR
jgi:hypothetical protein